MGITGDRNVAVLLPGDKLEDQKPKENEDVHITKTNNFHDAPVWDINDMEAIPTQHDTAPTPAPITRSWRQRYQEEVSRNVKPKFDQPTSKVRGPESKAVSKCQEMKTDEAFICQDEETAFWQELDEL